MHCSFVWRAEEGTASWSGGGRHPSAGRCMIGPLKPASQGGHLQLPRAVQWGRQEVSPSGCGRWLLLTEDTVQEVGWLWLRSCSRCSRENFSGAAGKTCLSCAPVHVTACKARRCSCNRPSVATSSTARHLGRSAAEWRRSRPRGPAVPQLLPPPPARFERPACRGRGAAQRRKKAGSRSTLKDCNTSIPSPAVCV